MKSDGNGSFVISKSAIALMTFLIFLVSTFASVVATQVTTQNKISNIENEQNKLENKVESVTDCCNSNSNDIAVIKTQYGFIKESLDDIKTKLK